MPKYHIVCPTCGHTGITPDEKTGGYVCTKCGHVFPEGTDLTRYFQEVTYTVTEEDEQ